MKKGNKRRYNNRLRLLRQLRRESIRRQTELTNQLQDMIHQRNVQLAELENRRREVIHRRNVELIELESRRRQVLRHIADAIREDVSSHDISWEYIYNLVLSFL